MLLRERQMRWMRVQIRQDVLRFRHPITGPTSRRLICCPDLRNRQKCTLRTGS